MNRGINHDGTYRQAVEVDQIDAAILAEELSDSTLLLLLRGGQSRKK